MILLKNPNEISIQDIAELAKVNYPIIQKAKADSRILAATSTATALGWILYEPFLLASAGLEEENKDEVVSKVAEILENILEIKC